MAVTIFLTILVNPQLVYSQTNKKSEKELVKRAKKSSREYKKEGWTLSGSSLTLEAAFVKHYAKLENEKNTELVGEVSQCKSINVCKNFALSNVQNYYASLTSGTVIGRTTSLLAADANKVDIETDKIQAAYEKQIKAEIGGALTESFSIVKDDGTVKEYKTFFILNEEEAGLARKRALRLSLIETGIIVEEAENISRFVNEGVDLE